MPPAPSATGVLQEPVQDGAKSSIQTAAQLADAEAPAE